MIKSKIKRKLRSVLGINEIFDQLAELRHQLFDINSRNNTVKSEHQPIKKITSFSKYDKFIECCALLPDSESMRPLWNTHILDDKSFISAFARKQNSDPFSEEYAAWEKDFFEFLSGSAYTLSNEGQQTISVDELERVVGSPMYAHWPIERFIFYQEKFLDLLQALELDKNNRVIEMGGGGEH